MVIKSMEECMEMLDKQDCCMLDFTPVPIEDHRFSIKYKLISNKTAFKLLMLGVPKNYFLHINGRMTLAIAPDVRRGLSANHWYCHDI